MDAPRLMLRFKNPPDTETIAQHNAIQKRDGSVLWGLWLKEFEDERNISDRLSAFKWPITAYFADTTSKSAPKIYIGEVRECLPPERVENSLVPPYYRDKIAGIPLWLVISSPMMALHANQELTDVLGVPTVYFLEYEDGRIKYEGPQRFFTLKVEEQKDFLLHLTDLHFGDDHGFKYPFVKYPKTALDSRRSLSDVLVQDLKEVGAYDRIGAVIVSGDLITRGKWDVRHEIEGEAFTGAELVKHALQGLSESLNVSPNRFFVVPGNHDIVREGLTAEQITEYLINYKHEMGFRRVRDEFSQVYKLSPLNYGVLLQFPERSVAIGLLNSAYLNEKANFKDYGFVGDDAEHVFEFLRDQAGETLKILVVHHHLTPIYERDVMGADGIVSITLDAAYILRRAQEVDVSVVLHGHQHAPKMIRLSSWGPEMDIALKKNPKALEIMAGGSAGARSERLPLNESNMYALISVRSNPPEFLARRIYNSGRRGESWG